MAEIPPTTTDVMGILNVKAKVVARWELEGKLVPFSKKGKMALYHNWQVMMIANAVSSNQTPEDLIAHVRKYGYRDSDQIESPHARSKRLEEVVARLALQFPHLDGDVQEKKLEEGMMLRLGAILSLKEEERLSGRAFPR